VRRKLDEIAALGMPVAALRRQVETESQQAQLGGISRGIEPPEPTSQPVERPPSPSPTRTAPRLVVQATATARPARRPSATPGASAEPEGSVSPEAAQPPPAVVRRVREAARRETELYRRALRAAGASAAVPYFRLEAVELRGWGAEVHLQAAVEDPEQTVLRLRLPRADRQFLRLVAARILEDAPELASVELHLALQNGRSVPVDLGSVRVDPELLKLTNGLSVDEFWEQVDARLLESAWQ
jgi:hypothetical protein